MQIRKSYKFTKKYKFMKEREEWILCPDQNMDLAIFYMKVWRLMIPDRIKIYKTQFKIFMFIFSFDIS